MKRKAISRTEVTAIRERPIALADFGRPQPVLKRRAALQSTPRPDPLDIFYSIIGSLGILYESQLVYLKHLLEQTEVTDQDDSRLVECLKAVHGLAVNICSSVLAREPLDGAAFLEFRVTTGRVMSDLAAEGKQLIRAIQEDREHK